MEKKHPLLQRPGLAIVVFIVTIVAVFLAAMLGTSIIERRAETAILQTVEPIKDMESNNEAWGKNYPRVYDSFLKTTDTTFKSAHGGSAMKNILHEEPNLAILWAGYAFSKDYNQARGHEYALYDIQHTLRTNTPMPATCWTCKSSDVPRVMFEKGVTEYYGDKWANIGKEFTNNIGCLDCHDNKTMRLRISRPALTEALERMGKNVNNATHQEMRSLVCAQCHVEYYFKGDGKYLTFPWDKGMTAEDMERYYDSIEFTDWTHALSRAPMLKAQHPDFELFSTGVHAERGVACADCHMPYKTEGGIKFSDHHLQSPLNNIAQSCGVCHRESEGDLRNSVTMRQNKVQEVKFIAQAELAKAHIEAKYAWDNGATAEQMKNILKLIRHAQWRWDWVAAANGVGFHSPLEAVRVLASSIEKAKDARFELQQVFYALKVPVPVPMPDIATIEKAQKYIGLDMEKERATKAKFLQEVLPVWIRATEQGKRNAMLPKEKVRRG